MTDQELLDCYARFLPFLSKVMGEGVEIALHDARRMQQSLIAIENSLSGRKAVSYTHLTLPTNREV